MSASTAALTYAVRSTTMASGGFERSASELREAFLERVRPRLGGLEVGGEVLDPVAIMPMGAQLGERVSAVATRSRSRRPTISWIIGRL